MIKRIEDLDFYELLNLPVDASEKDIRNAYILAVATYHPDALASYGVLSLDERRAVLDRIEQAFETLGNADARKAYNTLILPTRPEFRQRAFFRKSTVKLEIVDAEEEESLWGRLRSVLLPTRFREKKREPRNGKTTGDLAALQRDGYLFGEYLQRVREERGLSLEEAAEKCRISPEILKALEAEETSSVGDAAEIARLLRLYARCLGLGDRIGD